MWFLDPCGLVCQVVDSVEVQAVFAKNEFLIGLDYVSQIYIEMRIMIVIYLQIFK